ncbi:MAG: HEPN domain-containing protein [Gemmatimonadota bacterium]
MNDPRDEAGRWLRTAQEDLEYARYAAKGGHHAPACFHAQQAGEKAVKSVHYARGARAVIGHNIRALIETLSPRDDGLDGLLDAARELDLFYIASRYPNGLAEGTPGEAFSAAQASRALDLAERMIREVSRVVQQKDDLDAAQSHPQGSEGVPDPEQQTHGSGGRHEEG